MALFDPPSIMDNTPHLGNGYGIFPSKRCLRDSASFIKPSCLFDLGESQPCHSMKLAWLTSGSVFNRLISIVFSDGAQEKMSRVYAKRIVTFVANACLWGNGSFMHFVGYAMRAKAFVVYSKGSIFSRNRSRPQPARLSLFNVFPKALSGVHFSHCVFIAWKVM